MFQNTRAVLHNTIKAVAKAVFVMQIIIQIGMIAYLTYAVIANFTSQNWLWIPNMILWTVSVLYLIFCLSIERENLPKETKRTKKNVDRVKNIFSLLVKTATVGSSLYGVLEAGEEASAISVLVTAAVTIGWVVSAILEILKTIVSSRHALLIEAFEADVEPFVNIVHTPARIIHKLTGKGSDEEKRGTKKRRILDRLVETMKKDKEEKKRRKKEQKEREKETLPTK